MRPKGSDLGTANLVAKEMETLRPNGGPKGLAHWGTEQNEASDVQDNGSPKAHPKLSFRGFVAQNLLSNQGPGPATGKCQEV